MYKSRYIFFFLMFVSATTSGVFGQSPSEKTWSFLLEPYVLFPFMNGDVGVGTLPNVTVDADVSDIFSNLKIGAMLYAEAHTEDWVISSDIIYMNLKQDVKREGIINAGSLQAKQFAWELSGLRTVLPWLDLGLGARLNSLSTEVGLTINKPNEATNRNKKVSETWVDPILIARIKNASDEKIQYQFRGDIGGFGIGSDFAFQLQAYIGYRFSELFQLSAGYRIISMDYEKGSEENRFMYDVDTSGPVVRFGFNL
ncbi:hypothetical protein [Gelidibacter sp.]|uniref:hypothetical protein n=1 Tax=Gelidibacter sp. TaxID=2018083 RepID=UPI002B9DB842|nr:hypothetical protein [Gelidibacter sp.]HUH27686.1 hypothetical protein [Gelidibacter sp.]